MALIAVTALALVLGWTAFGVTTLITADWRSVRRWPGPRV